MNVLIVDDSKPMRMWMKKILNPFSFTLFEAHDAASAQELLANQLDTKERIGLMLLDWEMPGMSGLDLLKLLRADERYENLKIMMVTSRNDKSHVEMALTEGADDYLMKPIQSEMVSQKLQIIGLMDGTHGRGI